MLTAGYFRLFSTVCLAACIATARLAAQQPGEGERRPGMEGRRGPMFDPVLVDGPPAPDSFAVLVGLSEEQKTRYTAVYQDFMTATESDRAAARQARAALRDAATNRDRAGVREAMRQMRAPAEALEQQQRSFDAALKDFLAEDQLQRYGLWRESHRRRVRGGPQAGGPG